MVSGLLIQIKTTDFVDVTLKCGIASITYILMQL